MRFSALRALFGWLVASDASDPTEVANRLLKKRIVFLGTPIDDATANDVIARLLFLNAESATTPIQLIINSPGGLVLAGLAVMDTMDHLRAPVETHCVGIAHSMAAVILAYGRAGSRTAPANAIITFTLPLAPADGDEQKQKDAIRLGEILISKTATATRRPIAEIRQLFEEATDLSASDALATGILDAIVPPRL